LNEGVDSPETVAASPEHGDLSLVAQYRAGSEAAFAELVRRHQIPVFRLLLGMTSDADQAELLCEQVFFEAARRLPDWSESQSFGSWLLGLSRELAAKAEERRPKASAPRRIGPRPREPKARVKHEVRTALTELSSDERVALILADLQGDSLEDIARTLGTTAGEAERIVHTARTKFEQGLEQTEAVAASDEAGEALLEPGTLLDGRFRIESLLGKGGMGAVYRAIDAESGEPVALKTLLPSSERDPALRRRFAREAEVIERLQHPNFVRLIHHGQREGEPSYVAMELLDGDALNQVLEREQRIAPRRALHIVQHLLHGLSYAHERGVIHRDLKPENVMLLEQEADHDFAKLLDLGIAKLVGADDARRTRLTGANELIGTPLYISPEMLRGEALDGRADLYSLTVLLYEMLAARPPFEASTSTALFAMHLVTEPPALGSIAPEIAVLPLEQLLQAGLAKEPSRRIPSAASYLRRVEELLSLDWDSLPKASRAATTRPPAAKPRVAAREQAVGRVEPVPPPRVRRLLLGLGALLLAAVLAWLLLR
jgi:RNA polymerase sigma factor (sigma-70 family)